MPQFNEDGSENQFSDAVLKDPKGYRISQKIDQHNENRLTLKDFEFRDDFESAGWYRVTPDMAEKNEICEAKKYMRNNVLQIWYEPGDKPFLMRTVKWVYTQEPAPHIDMYRIGRNGKTEYYLNRYGMIKKWEDENKEE